MDDPGDAIEVPGARVWIPRAEVDVRTSPSGGPGGQHANRSATRVELRWDVTATSAVSGAERDRIVERLGEVVRVVADDERSQHRNRSIAEQRLATKVAGALRRDPPRRATRPTLASKRRRLDAKRRRSQVKRDRGRPTD